MSCEWRGGLRGRTAGKASRQVIGLLPDCSWSIDHFQSADTPGLRCAAALPGARHDKEIRRPNDNMAPMMRLQQRAQSCIIPFTKRYRFDTAWPKWPNKLSREQRLSHQGHSQAAPLGLDDQNILALDRHFIHPGYTMLFTEHYNPVQQPLTLCRTPRYCQEFFDQRSASLTPIPASHRCFKLAQRSGLTPRSAPAPESARSAPSYQRRDAWFPYRLTWKRACWPPG